MSEAPRPKWLLPDLLKAAGIPLPRPPLPDLPIERVTDDSREVGPKTLFVAMKGPQSDGHRFLDEAIRRGACAALTEEKMGPCAQAAANPSGQEAVVIRVASTRAVLGPLVQAFWDRPSRRLRLVGVTGTNGKTTVTWLIHHLLTAAGYPCGWIGTISYRVGQRVYPSENTTPGAVRLGELLDEMVRNRQTACAIEVSSHALDQRRTEGLHWSCAVFTNLNPEHLDYHKNLGNYLQAKLKLFQALRPGAFAVINRDDPAWESFCRASRAPVLTYGLKTAADLTASNLQLTLEGSSFELQSPQGRFSVRTPLVGGHNVENLLASLAAVMGLTIPLREVLPGAESFSGVPGRLERVDPGDGLPVFVDYAHTDYALRRVLETLRCLTRRKILVVFGCGGDRDRTKRPRMGQVAAGLSDRVVVTSDNPRSEDPAAIAQEITAGMKGSSTPFELVLDREEAIHLALQVPEEEWLVLIAGKGHEREQIVGNRRIPLDDREVALRFLRGRERVAR